MKTKLRIQAIEQKIQHLKAQLAALEKAKAEKEAHGEFESEHPGYCGAQDTFYVGNMKGVGRIYQQTFVDTYSKVALAKLYDRKTPLTAADLLNDRVIPFFDEQGVKLQRVLTDRGTEYCGKISYLQDPNYPADDKEGMAGLPLIDRYNPDPALRKRPLVGLNLMEGFRYLGRNSWDGGRIYNPENGKYYKATISLADNNRLMLRGYWGISLLGRTEIWVRSGNGQNSGA